SAAGARWRRSGWSAPAPRRRAPDRCRGPAPGRGSGPGRPARRGRPTTRAAPPPSPPPPPTRSAAPSSPARLAQARGERVDLRRAQLVGDAVGDEAGAALDDLLAHLQPVLLQR